MHVTNIPTVLSSLTFLLPFYAAVDTQNAITAFCWGALTTTSLCVHITKRPFHLHGHGNCIPAILTMDTIAVYVALVRAMVDGYYAGPIGLSIASGVVLWATIVFYVGQLGGMFAFDPRADMSILSHVSLHLLSSFGATGVIYLRSLKNGLETSTV
jgi:hypothetical protein